MQIDIDKMIEQMETSNAGGMILKFDCLSEKGNYEVKVEIEKIDK